MRTVTAVRVSVEERRGIERVFAARAFERRDAEHVDQSRWRGLDPTRGPKGQARARCQRSLESGPETAPVTAAAVENRELAVRLG